MARLNNKTPSIFTHEGAKAQHLKPYQQLQRLVLSCMLWEDTFYDSGSDIAKNIQRLVPLCYPKEIHDIALYARNQAKLRHVSLFLACEMTKHFKGRIVGDTVYGVIQRADELAEILAIYWRDGKCPVSKQLRVGLARAWHKFNAYQLAKYDRDNKVKLRDSLFLSHAKPANKAQDVLWKDLIAGRLPVPDTWETNLSAGADKRATFTRLLKENKLGYMALLRNLRNMVDANVPYQLVKSALIEGAAKSKALPFRFIAAAKAAPLFEPVLDEALMLSLAEMPTLPGKTVLLVDHSQSMLDSLSAKSDLTRFDAAAALAMLIRGISEESRVFTFSAGEDWYTRPQKAFGYTEQKGYKLWAEIPPRRGMALRDAMENSMGWGGTELGKAVRLMNQLDYDRLIVFTDEQSTDTPPAPHNVGYMVNIASYKNGVGYGKWTHINGFSESIVSFIQEFEKTIE